jgi:hypothetical protein
MPRLFAMEGDMTRKAPPESKCAVISMPSSSAATPGRESDKSTPPMGTASKGRMIVSSRLTESGASASPRSISFSHPAKPRSDEKDAASAYRPRWR